MGSIPSNGRKLFQIYSVLCVSWYFMKSADSEIPKTSGGNITNLDHIPRDIGLESVNNKIIKTSK